MSVLVPPAHLLGSDVEVPCADGLARRYVNLDYAATAPALRAAAEPALELLPYYGSIHRGAGVESATSTAAYEGARAVAPFGAAPDQIVVFVRNTTEALILLAHCLPAGARVLSTPGEHHANMLPWRRRTVDLLPFTQSAEELLGHTATALKTGNYDLLAISGASNVTGEICRSASSPSSRTPRRRDLRRCGATRAALPIDMADSRDRPSRALRPQALRAVRRGGARGARAAAPASRCCSAAARSSACSTTSSGATRPRASRPARRTCSARSRSPPPARR